MTARTHGRRFPIAAVAAALLVMVATGGCGPGGPALSTSRTQATVKGKVTVQGRPLEHGAVLFNPANAHRKDVPIARAALGPGGAYELTTFVGDNAVTVQAEGPDAKKLSGISAQIRDFNVASGENVVNIDLAPPAPAPARRGRR